MKILFTSVYFDNFQSMASSDMDLNQAETFLSSQVKKKDSNFSETQAKVMLKFWKNHKERVHESLVQRCVWSDKLKNLSWRIDIQSRGRHVEQMNVPTAIVELQLENKTNQEEEVRVKSGQVLWTKKNCTFFRRPRSSSLK